jgi:hypothetical protein
MQQAGGGGEVGAEQAQAVAAEAVFYKTYAGMQVSFGLPLEFFPCYERLLENDASLVQSVNVMIRGAVAKSTATQYKPVLLEFHKFCVKFRYDFP